MFLKRSFLLKDSEKQKRKTEKRLKKLKMFLENPNNLAPNLMFEVDSDQEFSNVALKIGDEIDYL